MLDVAETASRLRFADVPKLELDQLIDQLVERAQDVKRAQGRLRALLRAIETVTGDLALEVVLRNVVESAVELAQAEYGALGVIGPDGGLEQFIHVGIDDETAKRIGHLPQGKGLLGALITDPRPIRLRQMTDDARSTGFPPNHPAMHSFLGVPIHVRDEVFGNLYLSNSARGEFGIEDEELVIALALAAGTAISNARLYDESKMQQRWLEASLEIGNQLLSPSGEDPLRLVARRAIEVADADLVGVSLLTSDGAGLVVEEAFGLHADDIVGRRFALAGTLAQQVLEGGEPFLTSNAADPALPQTYMSSVLEVGPLMALPIRGGADKRGVLSVLRVRGRRAFTTRELSMAAGFAAHASVALELADSRAAEQKLLLLEDRDRIAMDLHDHVIQELFAIGLSLEGAATALGREDPVSQRIRQRVEDIDRTIRRIRTSIFELRGALAAPSEGLRQRILEVVSDLTPALGFAPHVAFAGLLDVPLPDGLDEDVLACVRESLTNVAKHAHATTAVVDIALAGGTLIVTVTDDGVGMSELTRRSGTANLLARAQKWAGSYELTPAVSGGTIATWKASV
jgi:signal transduction histidine kinase